MKAVHDLGSLEWRLTGWAPYFWRLCQSMETGATAQAEIPPIPARVPGSVQGSLRDAGLLPDWNEGLNARLCEWVENRHWIYEADIPDDWLTPCDSVRLNALGLDDRGWVWVNGKEVAGFKGSFVPHEFDLTPFLEPSGNRLAIVFDCPPRWLGQAGFTSQMKDWRPRFNYTWDWTSRLVQIGIWDDITLEVTDRVEFGLVHTRTSCSGDGISLTVQSKVFGNADAWVRISLRSAQTVIWDVECTPHDLRAGVTAAGLPVERWWPNSKGDQPLYDLRLDLVTPDGVIQDTATRRIGFREITWQMCEGAPLEADPWICAVNGEPTFLQGVNWTPIRPNFADVSEVDYRKRLELYRGLGVNVLRVWGGAFLEKQCFYDICDELGLLVWQEFPLSSSGLDNWPPEDEHSVAEMAVIACSYIERRRHHPCLLLWSGGNELQGTLDGGRFGCGKPCDLSHPMLKRLSEIVAEEDPKSRFIATSAGGPRFTADETEFGEGVHWDVHGPWNFEGAVDGWWTAYWNRDDALFRSEAGAPGASPVDLIREIKGGFPELPGTEDNPLWRRTSWWIEWHQFVEIEGREPSDLEEYVAWSQGRQAAALSVAARASKSRFPRCGGFIVWMGHDSFPCTANTSIVDFHGRPKPAALSLGEVFGEE